jgi:hypothetical protein
MGPMVGRRLMAAAFAAAWLIMSAQPGRAQEAAASYVLVNVPRLSQLNISGDVSQLLTLIADGTGQSAYDNGGLVSAADATQLSLSTNDRWDLSARLGGLWSCPEGYTKAQSDLRIRISNTPTGTIENGASSFITLGSEDTQLLSHDQAVSDNLVNIQTQVLLDWTKDVPGAYAITVTYTVVTHLP